MTALTPTQRETLRFIIETIAEWGFPPTTREMCRRFGVSTNAVHDRLRGLQRKGAIEMANGDARAIRVCGVRWDPVLVGASPAAAVLRSEARAVGAR